MQYDETINIDTLLERRKRELHAERKQEEVAEKKPEEKKAIYKEEKRNALLSVQPKITNWLLALIAFLLFMMLVVKKD